MTQFARLAGFAGVLALLVALGSDEVLAQKKDKKADPDGDPAVPADYAKLQNAKEIYGTIVGMGGGGKTILLRVDFPHYEPNPNYKAPKDPTKVGGNPQANQQYQQMMQSYQNLMRQKEQAMRAKSPIEQQRAMQRIQQDMAKLQMQMQKMYYPKGGANPPKANPNNEMFRLVTTSKDYELELQDKAAVRKLFLALEYDDTGNLKKYSDKEKAELRGDDKTKPGYMAKLDEIVAGGEAKLYLTPSKKKAAKADDEGVGNVDRPTVNMVLLTKESPTPGMIGAPPKKNAKKDKK